MSEASVLLVDDEALNLEILVEYFEGETSLALQTADSGEAAWQLLQHPGSDFKLILLDRMMPGMDGISLLRLIKDDPRLCTIPVIMQTAANSPAQIREGLEAGAFYYLTKPYRREEMLSVVHSALADARAREALRQQLREHVHSLQFMDQGSFSIRTLKEAGHLASFIAQACPNPDTAVIGISELLVNGIEHGNLGLSYEEKSRLKREDTWHTEVERLTNLPENSEKRVQLDFSRNEERITLTFIDQGQGFAWESFLSMSPERAFDPNGRGIALARLMSFATIHYEGCGNIAVATINSPASNNEQN